MYQVCTGFVVNDRVYVLGMRWYELWSTPGLMNYVCNGIICAEYIQVHTVFVPACTWYVHVHTCFYFYTSVVSGKAAAWRVLGMMHSLRKRATLKQSDTWLKERRLRLHHAGLAHLVDMVNKFVSEDMHVQTSMYWVRTKILQRMLFYVVCLWETIVCAWHVCCGAPTLNQCPYEDPTYMILFWYLLSTYWYVPVCTNIHFLLLYVPSTH